MLNITGKYISVFQAEVKEGGKVMYANLSSSKKNTDSSGNITYENMSWKARFVGNALQKALVEPLKDTSKIDITSGAITNEWDKDKQKAYVNVTVFDYEMSETSKK